MKLSLKNDLDFAIVITAEMLAHELYWWWDNYVCIDQHEIQIIFLSIFSRYDDYVINQKERVYKKAFEILVKNYKVDNIFEPKPKRNLTKEEVQKRKEKELKQAKKSHTIELAKKNIEHPLTLKYKRAFAIRLKETLN